MTVLDCIDEYENLGEKVFGKPRLFFTLRFGLGDRTKYKASRLQKVFEDVAARRNEHLTEPDRSITFPSGRGLCNTYVFHFIATPCFNEQEIHSKGSVRFSTHVRTSCMTTVFVFQISVLENAGTV